MKSSSLYSTLVIIVVAGCLYWGYQKWDQSRQENAVTVAFEANDLAGEEATYAPTFNKVFDAAVSNYWILQNLNPDERELAMEVLFSPYYVSKTKKSLESEKSKIDSYLEEAKNGELSGVNQSFRGFFWQAQLDLLAPAARQRVEWQLGWNDRRALEEVRDLRTDLQAAFFKEFNDVPTARSTFVFKICNNRSVPLKKVSYWVSGFARGSIPEGLNKKGDFGSSTEFKYDKAVSPKTCVESSLTGFYKLFNYFEVVSVTPQWDDSKL